MKTRYFVLSLVLLLGLFLAACSQQASPAETMTDEKGMAAETMDENEDAMMDDVDMKDDAVMEDDEAMMEDKEDDAMMEDKGDGTMDDGDAMMEDHEDDMMSDDEGMDDHDDEMMDERVDESAAGMIDDSMAMTPEWLKTTLTDVNSGEAFALADLKGNVVLVETLAMWCSNCLKQQGQVQSLHDLVGERDDFISLGLDIDPNENAEALKTYTANNGFDWVYAVAPTEVAREIGQLYGDQFLNPPSTPMLIVDRDGEVHLLPFGIKSAEDLLDALQPFLDAEM